MAKLLKVIGLLALLHQNNAATLRCVAASNFGAVEHKKSGECTLKDPKDVTKLTIVQDSVTDSSSRDILPYTHYTLPYPNTTASQDYIQFNGELSSHQAYTHYITPKRDVVTICSPFECIYLSGVTSHFYITASEGTPKEECPENQFIFVHEDIEKGSMIGACATLTNSEHPSTILITSTPSSFFYFSQKGTKKYHVIDHRSSPPQENESHKIFSYSVGTLSPLTLTHFEDYNNYFSTSESSQYAPLLGVTGTFYLLEKKDMRRYIVQTHTALYSLLERDNNVLSLQLERKESNGNDGQLISSERVLLQIFPDGFKLPSKGLPETLRYSALYNNSYGYENRIVKQTVTGAYSLMRAMDYVNAMGGDMEKPMAKLYAQFGATYLFSRTNYLRNVGKEKERKAMAGMLKASGNKDWDQMGQGAPRNDKYLYIGLENTEGCSVWLGLENADGKEEDSNMVSKTDEAGNARGHNENQSEAAIESEGKTESEESMEEEEDQTRQATVTEQARLAIEAEQARLALAAEQQRLAIEAEQARLAREAFEKEMEELFREDLKEFTEAKDKQMEDKFKEYRSKMEEQEDWWDLEREQEVQEKKKKKEMEAEAIRRQEKEERAENVRLAKQLERIRKAEEKLKEENAKAEKRRLRILGGALLIATVVLVVALVVFMRMNKKPSANQIHHSSALLHPQGQLYV